MLKIVNSLQNLQMKKIKMKEFFTSIKSIVDT